MVAVLAMTRTIPMTMTDTDTIEQTAAASAAATKRPRKAKGGKIAAKTRAKARQPRTPADAAGKAKSPQGTKQAKLIDLLKRAKGASIAEMAEALGWQSHTIRGAIAGALKKKLGLQIESGKDEKRGRVYRIT